MTTEEIKAMLSDPEQSEEVLTAAIVYCNEGEKKLKDELAARDEEIKTLKAQIETQKKQDSDNFISELVKAGKLAPKDEDGEKMWRETFAMNPETARKMAEKVQGSKPDTEAVAGGKAGATEDERSAESLFNDELKQFNS